MKKFIKPALMVCAALTLGLVSCSKEENSVNGKDKTVVLSFSQEGLQQSRAASTHVDASTAVVMSNARVYFVDNGGAILSYCAIDFTAGGKNLPYDAASKTVGVDQITAAGVGAEITAVPGSTTKVVIVGNYPSAYPTTGNISQLNAATAITVQQQFDATGKGVDKVVLFGENTLTTVDAANNKYSSKVQIEPIASRIEIGTISGDFAGSTIKSFTLNGIYINRYYPTMGINGVAMGTIINNGSDAAKYNGAVGGSSYAAFDEMLADYTASRLVAQGSPANKYGSKASVGTNDVWAYNLLAPVGGATPSIVVRVNNVVTNDGVTDDAVTYAGVKFLTIRNFYLSTAPTTPLASLDNRNVYRIKELKFAEFHLTPNPEMNLIDITVEAEVMTWIPNDVDYDFN